METRVYSWGDGRPWHSYAAYCRRHFGGRVRKIAVDAGLSCPNRDGTIGSEGCTFCDNRAFTPSYCSPRKSLARQIDEGIAFHAARGRDEGLCLVYFQPFSNTHAPVARLRELYAEALAHPRISGLVIGTRPDCVDDEKLDLLAELARKRYVAVEYGVESTCDETLRAVRRGHDFAAARQAIAASAARGCTSGPISFWGCPAKTTKCFFDRWSGSMPCRSKRSSSTSCSSFGNGPCRAIRRRARPLPPAYLRGVSLAGGRGVAAAASRYGCGAYRQRSADGVSPLDAVAFNAGFHPLVPARKRLTARNAYQGEIFIPLRR